MRLDTLRESLARAKMQARIYARQRFCGLSRHDYLLHFIGPRMCLQCGTCGYETPGWDTRSTSNKGDQA